MELLQFMLLVMSVIFLILGIALYESRPCDPEDRERANSDL